MPIVEDERPIADAVRAILTAIGEDPEREGLADTPGRVERQWAELTSGYGADPATVLGTTFEVEYDEMVVVRDIAFYSLCEHHLLPFHGRVQVGYLPKGRVVGLSKIPRLVEAFAHRLQVQERMTQQIAETLMTHLDPKGVAVVVEAAHLCTMMRGVRQQEAVMITSAMLGTFRSDARTRSEFLTLIGSSRTTASLP
jgi:GTP cyclohydrolase I